MRFFRTVLLPGVLFSTVCGTAQSVTIQNVSAPVEYYRMPDEPFDPAFRTYSTELDVLFRDIANTTLSKSSLEHQYLKLEGYGEVANGGDIEISAGIGEFFVWGEFRKTSRHKIKGKVVVKYYLEVKYSQPISVQVRDRNGVVHLDKYLRTNADTHSWISPSYERASDLDAYWRIQRSARLGSLQKEHILEGMKNIHELVNNQFGYRRISENIRFETIGRKHHPDHDRYLQHVEILQAAFQLMDADKDLDEVKAKVKPALGFYAAEADKYKSNSKDDQRLRHICLYNQALTYFWIEEFDRAQELATTLQQQSGKDKDARRLLEAIQYTRMSLQKANRTSRHGVALEKSG